jgi:hypothetical protein
VAELRHSIRGEVLREAGTPSQRQKTKELAQGRVHRAVRHEAKEEGAPRARKEEGVWKPLGTTLRPRQWIGKGQEVCRQGSVDATCPRHRCWGRASLLGNFLHSDEKNWVLWGLTGIRLMISYKKEALNIYPLERDIKSRIRYSLHDPQTARRTWTLRRREALACQMYRVLGCHRAR